MATRRGIPRVVCGWVLAGLSASTSASSPAEPEQLHPAAALAVESGLSVDASLVARWVARNEDNRGMPFVIVDKFRARLYVFSSIGRLVGESPVLLGLSVGDESIPDIAERTPASLAPAERTTPAGRFASEPGHNARGEDIVWFDYDASLEGSYPYDPAKAEATLKAGGWTKPGEFWEKDGKTLTLKISAISTSAESPLLAQALQGYLRKVGMDAQVFQMAVPAWLAANIKGDMSLAALQYIAVDSDALHLWFLPDQYFNWSHYTNPQLTDLIMQGQKESDPAKRFAIYAKAQKILMDEAVIMPIRENVDLLMTTRKLTGVTWSGGGFEYFGAATMAK